MELTKVGEKALVVASTKDYIKPPEKPEKKILGEEKYSKDLEKIIERDFFPDLPKFKVQEEYLDALEKNDTETIRRLHHKYGPKRLGLRAPPTLATPSTFDTPVANVSAPGHPNHTPATFETPIADPKQTPVTTSTSQGNQPTRNPEPHEVKPKKTDADLPLDKYLSKNTSEDNAAFEEIIKESEKKHRNKHAWLYEKEREQIEEQDKYLALPSMEKQAITSGNSRKLDTWTYEHRNKLMYVPDGVDLSDQEKIEMQGKKAREIVHSNTRFKAMPFNLEKSKASIQDAANTHAVIQTGKIGVDGKEVIPTETPKVNGYSFISDPSPAPGVGVDESPVMRWGEIEGTPFRFDGSGTPLLHKSSTGPQFRIPEVPKRDQLGLELAEKNSKAHRDKKQQALKQAAATFAVCSPAFGHAPKTGDRLQNMSPAAQRLASTKLGLRVNTDKALRASYSPSPGASIRRDRTPGLYGLKTPTPSSSSSSSSARKRNANSLVRLTPGATPGASSGATSLGATTSGGTLGVGVTPELGMQASSAMTPAAASSAMTPAAAPAVHDISSLTDNLLNLPKKRSKASEFF